MKYIIVGIVALISLYILYLTFGLMIYRSARNHMKGKKCPWCDPED